MDKILQPDAITVLSRRLAHHANGLVRKAMQAGGRSAGDQEYNHKRKFAASSRQWIDKASVEQVHLIGMDSHFFIRQPWCGEDA